MKTFGEINAALRRQNKKNYLLLGSCIFFSVLLITAYVSMMRSPTVLTILPEGGDSRKQVMMIFGLAAVGCGVFTTYAGLLFFRYKSREVGIFMALGASRAQIRGQLFKELTSFSTGACLIGALLGTPLAWCIWQFFRLLLVDTQEMSLSFDPQAYLIAATFTAFVLSSLLVMGKRFIGRTNVMDVVNEQRKSEPIHDVRPWCGPVGILLIVIGCFGGYFLPVFFVTVLRWYPPAWTNIAYLPLLIGLYMVLIHTVVRGWRHGKSRYKNIITHSMMKFQGRQTVNNMLVITVLIAGAYFAAFYSPMLGTGAMQETQNRPIDYAFHYRADQNMLTRTDIEKMVSENGVTITSWKNTGFAVLGRDGQKEIDDEGGKYHFEYRTLNGEGNYIPESSFNFMTGQNIDIMPGKFAAVIAEDGTGDDRTPVDSTLLTNMTTRKTLNISFQEYLHYDMMAASYYVLDDADYGNITAGLADEWFEKLVYFNVENDLQTYDFAKKLFSSIVDRSGPECELPEYYDRVEKIAADEAGETYWGDTSSMTQISYAQRDSSQFKQFWKYVPQFRVLDRSDFVATYAVFLMLFVFIAIVCFAAVLVIGYTRCLTIAINNRQVYEDLRHLGATPQYLYRSVRGQISKVFGVPAFIGTSLIYIFYIMILFFNDNRMTKSEISGLINCLFVVLGMSAVIWAFYRFTLRKVCGMLKVNASNHRGL
ncbi:putative ABC transporter permease protein [Oscillibacter valericigenes Sjm18-20]|nr:putative ABC transporter permease protein [Oscillibacter valericigenes Sjm18-20]